MSPAGVGRIFGLYPLGRRTLFQTAAPASRLSTCDFLSMSSAYSTGAMDGRRARTKKHERRAKLIIAFTVQIVNVRKQSYIVLRSDPSHSRESKRMLS